MLRHDEQIVTPETPMTEGDTMTGSTTDQRHLAALLDGEHGPDGFEGAILAVERDDDLRARFERSLVIGQVLRGESWTPEARRVGAGVSTALATEPPVFRAVGSASSRRSRGRPRAPVNRPAAALAIAASLVAVAVLVGPSLLEDPRPEPAAVADSAASSVPSWPAVDGRLAADPDARVVERWTMDEPAGTTALDTLLVDHRERASASALTGFIPYAAVVGRSGLR